VEPLDIHPSIYLGREESGRDGLVNEVSSGGCFFMRALFIIEVLERSKEMYTSFLSF
jgi:hypothetical protein